MYQLDVDTYYLIPPEGWAPAVDGVTAMPDADPAYTGIIASQATFEGD
jgi:hypothetical protein